MKAAKTTENRSHSNIVSLSTLSLSEARRYLSEHNQDEVKAAYALAVDRNILDGSDAEPDATEIHHALFLLRRCQGLEAPSFDLLRFHLRNRAA